MSIGDPEFKLSTLVLTWESLCQTRLYLRDSQKQQPSELFEPMVNHLEQINVFLDKSGLGDTKDKLESKLTDLKERSGLVDWQEWLQIIDHTVDHGLQDELSRLPLVLLPEPYFNIETRFNAGIFELLPLIARDDFQEAANCYVCEQYTAAVVLAWRAAEATLREYRYRLTDNDPENIQNITWQTILTELENNLIIDERLLKELRQNKAKRNQFAHPQNRLEAGQRQQTWDQVQNAIQVSSALIADLINRRKKIHVGVRRLPAINLSTGIHLDIILALLILDEKAGGTGRLTELTDSYNAQDFNYLIGMDDGKFGILETESGGKTISQQIAKDLKVGDQFKQLLEFTRRLRFNPENLSISPCPEQTLQQILKTAEVEYESSPINYREIILKLLHMIQGSPGLDPFDDYFVHDLSSKADPKDFQILINQTEKRLGIQAQQMQDEELAWKNRLQVEYDNASGFIIEAASEEGDIHSNFNKKPMDSILNKAWHHDADFLLYFDSEERRLWMRIQKGKRVDCRPLYRAFKKIVDKDEIFERGRSVGFDVGGLSIISGDIQAIVRSTNEELSHKREEDQEEVNDITNDLDSSFKDLE